jgi:hypothetical protein
MKKILLSLLLCLALTPVLYGQSYNWADALPRATHIVSAQLGWEYAAIAGLSYGYRLPTCRPLVFQAGISAPFGQSALDDFTLQAGLRGVAWERHHLKAILALGGSYQHYASELVRIGTLGAELQAELGIYRPRWFVAGETGLHLGLAARLRHSEIYTQTIYATARDGWYGPVSGGFVHGGIQTGYSFKRNDLVFRIGYLQSVTSGTNALIPYYTTLGYNWRIQ